MVESDQALFNRLWPVYQDAGILHGQVTGEYFRCCDLGMDCGVALAEALRSFDLLPSEAQVEPVPMDDAEYEEVMAAQEAMEGL